MRVAAVVVNWNGGPENLACLASLREQGAELERVYFVDNASTSGSFADVPREFPEVVVLENERNVGYGGGNNRGIYAALEQGFDAVLVVNNDVTFPPGTLAPLVRELEQPGVGIVGPRVLFAGSDRIWAAGGSLTWRQNLTTLIGQNEPDGPRWRRTVDVDYVTGCSMLVRREVFEKIGTFDADYFAYTEDVDFCLRARKAGFVSRTVGEVHVHHAPSSATGGGYNPRRKYMMGVNSVWFLRRWAGPFDWMRFVLFDVLSLPFVGLVELFRGRGRSVLAKALGIVDGLRGRRITEDVLRPGASRLW